MNVMWCETNTSNPPYLVYPLDIFGLSLRSAGGARTKFGDEQVGKDCFNVDVEWPLSLLQAFAICLSRFDTNAHF